MPAGRSKSLAVSAVVMSIPPLFNCRVVIVAFCVSLNPPAAMYTFNSFPPTSKDKIIALAGAEVSSSSSIGESNTSEAEPDALGSASRTTGILLVPKRIYSQSTCVVTLAKVCGG